MNKFKTILAVIAILAFMAGGFAFSYHTQIAQADFSNIQFFSFATSTNAWVGKDIATRVAGYNPRRSYIELGNLSGATSTAQAIYCSTSQNVTAYTGFTIQASSSKVFNLNSGVPIANIYCRTAISSSTISIVEI